MSLLQDALKRKEQDESQRKPEREAENVSNTPPAKNSKLSLAPPRPAESRPAVSSPDSPPKSMPVVEQAQPATEQAQPAVEQQTQPAVEQQAQPAVEQTQADAVHNIKRKTSMLWMIVAVIAVVVGLAITAGITSLFYRTSSPLKAKTIQQAKIDNDLSAVVTAASTADPDAKVLPVPKPESATTAQTTTSQPAVPGAEKEAALVVTQPQTVGVGKTKTSPTKSTFIKPKKFFRNTSVSVKWPVLKLMGILRGTGNAESTAFINGKIVSVGQAIADVTLIEVQADGVILKYGNEQRFLRIGATSY